MKPVQSTLKKWMQENQGFKENYIKIKEEVLQDPEIREFLSHYPELPKEEIDRNLIKLYEYKTQVKQCVNCTSVESCPNIIKGYSPILKVENNSIHLSYEKCHLLLEYEKQKEQKRLFQSLYIPKEILNASFEELDGDKTRDNAIQETLLFLEEAKTQLPARGLFYSGPFGVGKTYFLGSLANELKKFNISSMLIYMPEFIREIKASFKDDSTNEKIDYFKKADVLMLDDIGAETQSAWFRDEILGSILQYRMMERLPVFFTSNYTMKQLEVQLAKTTRGEIEEVKAGRIIERIKQVSKEVTLKGENRREK